MTRIFVYARVSPAEQLNENQHEQIAGAGYAIPPRRFIEEKISGSVPALQRPGFRSLVEKLEPGDTLVVTKLDRLGRDSIDVQQTVQAFTSAGVRLIVLQLGNMDLTSSTGGFTLKMLAAVADFERELIVERTQAGQARARAAGTHMGRPAKTNPKEREEIRERLAAGETVSEVARSYKLSRATVIGIRSVEAGQRSA